jgi:single-strand DNA-binding protein
MPNHNSVTIVGHIARDPEVRETKTGKHIASFTVAVSHEYNGKKEVDFIPCKAWRKMPDIKRGDAVCVIGRVVTESWEKDGKKNYKTLVQGEFISKQPREEKPEDESTNDYLPF